jgi:hypothetical protein
MIAAPHDDGRPARHGRGEIGIERRWNERTPLPITQPNAGDWRYGCDERRKTAAPGTKLAI